MTEKQENIHQLVQAIVLSKIDGAAKALDELERIESDAQLKSYHLFYSTKAEFFIQLGLFENAVKSHENAIGLAPLISIRELLKKKLEFCKEKLFKALALFKMLNCIKN